MRVRVRARMCVRVREFACVRTCRYAHACVLARPVAGAVRGKGVHVCACPCALGVRKRYRTSCSVHRCTIDRVCVCAYTAVTARAHVRAYVRDPACILAWACARACAAV